MFSAITNARLAQAATLANTAPGPRGGRIVSERLDSTTQLAATLPGWGFDDSASSTTLRSVRKLRSAIAGIWQDADALDIEAALEGIDNLLSAAGPVRVVVPGEHNGSAAPTAQGAPLHADGGSTSVTPARAPAVLTAGHDADAPEKVLSTSLALALAEVSLAGELTRLRTCSGEDCTNAFVDLTRNRSKQFCDEANCANRAHVKAYRARRAAEAGYAAGDAAGGSDSDASGGSEKRDRKDKKDKSGKKKSKKEKEKKR